MDNIDQDSFYKGKQFQEFFKSSPQSLVLKVSSLNFKVLAVSSQYLLLTYKQRNELLGKNLFEVFPGSSADPSEQYSVFSSFMRVISLKTTDELPVFKYEIFVPQENCLKTEYWSNLNEPILNGQGEVAYIINTTANITDQVLSRQAQERTSRLEDGLTKEQLLNEELNIANEELQAINEELQESQQRLEQLNIELEERVATRTKALADSEMMLNAAITSANLGTWFINSNSREFIPSERTKVIFGFHPDEPMSLQAAINQILQEYRGKAVTFFEAAITKGGAIMIEYPITGFRDGKQRWIRATGELYQAGTGKSAHFSGTVLDITDGKLDEQRKNDFIAMVSHELKTPLTSLKAYVQMLAVKARKAEDSFTSLALDKVNAQVLKMTGMIDSFLNVSRLESGKIHLEKTDFDLDELTRESVEEISLIKKSHHIYFHPCPPLSVYADREKIGQVINNLLSNAVKYSTPGSHIDVSCSRIDQMAQVRIKDQGEGIRAQDAAKIFERFYRVQSPQTQTVSGFGIGLYICSEIVRWHDGTIDVESEPGQGSTFYFNLPLS